MRKIKLIILMLIISVLLISFSGCQKRIKEGNTSKNIITIAGSTSVQPLADELAKSYMDKNPQVQIQVQGGGSSVGIKSAKDGIADIGTSSRELKADEKGLHQYEIAIDGIAIVVHPDNKINNLTVSQIRDIYTGKITNWKELGGNDAKITVVTREEGSGTRGAFEELVMDKKPIIDSAVVQPATGSVKQTVSQDKNAIGYISVGVLDNSIKVVSVENVMPTEENIKNKIYKIQRPFLFLTNKEPSGVVKDFIDFALSSEGQSIVEKHHYIKVK
ncbi:phosphate ABC transporter substrate-binding protein [Caldicellulosiruptoraceae bacterium PP1]